jgi:hypothetical protein
MIAEAFAFLAQRDPILEYNLQRKVSKVIGEIHWPGLEPSNGFDLIAFGRISQSFGN